MHINNRHIKLATEDKIYLVFVYIFLIVFTFIIIYPLVYVVSASFSSPTALISGRVFLWPVEPGLQGYRAIFNNQSVWTGYWNTIVYTFWGTLLGTAITIVGGYVLSRREFPMRGPILLLFTITMFFNGGMIPTYLLIRQLGMLDTMYALIIPGAFSVWLGIIARTYIRSSIPEELYEAVCLDGGDYFHHFFRIVLPLSKPILAVLALNFATGHWNSFYSAMLYLSTPEKAPLQIVLRSILIQNTIDYNTLNFIDVKNIMDRQYLSELLKYSLIVVSSVPLIIIYPFLQKYFVKGIMVGSIKG